MTASKFTPEVRGALVERAAAGVSLRDSCRAVDVREKTAKGWLTRGRSEAEGDYAEFAAAVDRARAAAKARPDPMDADELTRVVSEMVRGGSVAAAKLRFEMLRAAKADAGEEGGEVDGDPLAEVDELARKRRAG